MKTGDKTIFYFLAGLCSLAICYFFWSTFAPVKIIAVHQRDNYSDVLVDRLPLTDRGKIGWWRDNRQMLKARYGIPAPTPEGNYTVNVWRFGEGYQREGKEDRLCFKDMPAPINCIDKDRLFAVSKSPNLGTRIMIDGGADYSLDDGH